MVQFSAEANNDKNPVWVLKLPHQILKQKRSKHPLALTKQTIIEKISEEIEQSPLEAKDTIEYFLEIMKSTLASGENVMISGFGKFQVNEKAPRKGRNPATDEEMMLKGRRVVTFKCAGILRDRINGEED